MDATDIIELIPADREEFKRQLLKVKRAEITLTYTDGTQKVDIWNAYKFSSTSDLMNNIRTQSRIKNHLDTLVKAVYRVCAPTVKSPKYSPAKKPIEKTLRPYIPPLRGEDQDKYRVKYADNVPIEERVPGLSADLEEEYGKIIEFAYGIFGDQWNIPDPVEVILKKECPFKTYTHNDEYIQDKINELINKGKQASLKDIQRIIRHQDRILGRFFKAPTPRIEVYFNQFKANCYEDYFAQIAQTLAHEYAHYLEYAYCKIKKADSYKEERVSEAIADFFGVLYSLKRYEIDSSVFDCKTAQTTYKAWVNFWGSGWPYSYAYCFVENMPKPLHIDLEDYYAYDSIYKLVQVFKATPNESEAFRKLMS